MNFDFLITACVSMLACMVLLGVAAGTTWAVSWFLIAVLSP